MWNDNDFWNNIMGIRKCSILYIKTYFVKCKQINILSLELRKKTKI